MKREKESNLTEEEKKNRKKEERSRRNLISENYTQISVSNDLLHTDFCVQPYWTQMSVVSFAHGKLCEVFLDTDIRGY